MKRVMIVLAILTTIAALNAERSLWNKAMEIADENWNFVPGLSTTIAETKDLKSQEINSSMQYVIKHSLYEGIVMNEIVFSSVNEEKESVEKAAKRYAEMLKKDRSPSREGMFFEAPGKHFKLKDKGTNKEINGFECRGFDFSYHDKESKETRSGTVWLDKESGAPIRKEYSPDKNPRFVTGIDMVLHYNYNPENGEWFLSSADTIVHISALGKKLINNTTVTFEDHWR